ncbi:hypothetical protein [Phytomonospora endophytica]|uniref:Helix-turn-helix domain-containing protein n=1 Tax=Phytomonospora endophytica TaxID=714109 RepID=A0A841FKA1_9ACTN|nr:hypothetical protein [Phytomonospora endophytica]MBB6037761.1 hypothetical protein [Phytomonospora endophytica]GIG67709.1 hypothetical protein Pen01_40040 [Phytomonospora endophytica]
MTCKPNPSGRETWTVEQAAEFLRMTPESLLFLGEIGAGPPHTGVGWYIAYDPDQVREWLWNAGKPISLPLRAKHGWNPSKTRKTNE